MKNSKHEPSLLIARFLPLAIALGVVPIGLSQRVAPEVPADDVRLTLVESRGGFAPGRTIAGAVRQSGDSVVEGVVNDAESGAARAVRFVGKGEVEIEVPASRLREQDDGIAFYTLRLRPVLREEGGEPVEAVVDGARIGFVRSGPGVAELLALDFGWGRVSDDWVHTGVYFPVRPNGELQMHGELALRLDQRSKSYDLYVDGALKAAGLGYQPGRPGIRIQSGGDGPTSVGSLWHGDENPLFEDKDRDGRRDD